MKCDIGLVIFLLTVRKHYIKYLFLLPPENVGSFLLDFSFKIGSHFSNFMFYENNKSEEGQ